MEDSPSLYSMTSARPTKASDSKISLETSSESKGCSSNTKFLRRNILDPPEYVEITREEYEDVSETISGSSDTFQCEHGPEGKKYTEKGLLKRFLLKKLDRVPDKAEWNEGCLPDDDSKSGAMIEELVFLVSDSTVEQQMERLIQDIQDYSDITKSGFKITELDNLRLVLDFLNDNLQKYSTLKNSLESLLRNMKKPIRLTLSSDISKYFESLQAYMAYLGHLLIIIQDDDLFGLVYAAVVIQLTAPNTARDKGTVKRHQSVAASATLHQMSGKMIAVASPYKFPYFLRILLMLAYISDEYCIKMMHENIIENIFYRFNPYYPHRELPDHDINPRRIDDYRLKLGESSINLDTTLTLLLVLIKTTKEFLDKNPARRQMLPCPDTYAQKCLVWAYRYECRAQAHKMRSSAHRITMTIVINGLLYVFRDQLVTLTTDLMPDVLTLSVLSELPPRRDWTSTVPFNTSQLDVQFKKVLIKLSVSFIRVVPVNRFMITSRSWLLGIMYLVDPGLRLLRVRWVPSLYDELQKLALQSLVLTLPLMTGNIVQEFGLIRRILWFLEWYTNNPYEVPTLYWATRVLQMSTHRRLSDQRMKSVDDLVNSHGFIIIIKLCHTLLDQKNPPIEMRQVILGVCLRILTTSMQYERRVTCIVYPEISWPSSVSPLAMRVLDVVVAALEINSIICDRRLKSIMREYIVPFRIQPLDVASFRHVTALFYPEYLSTVAKNPQAAIFFVIVRLIMVHQEDIVWTSDVLGKIITSLLEVLVSLMCLISFLQSQIYTFDDDGLANGTAIKMCLTMWLEEISMFQTVLQMEAITDLCKRKVLSGKLLVALLDFIWELVWKKNYRQKFIEENVIYKLLDLITMTRGPTQCIALAIICDIARAGDGVGHLVSWRASNAASQANPPLVKRGATIAVLLAAIFRDACRAVGVRVDDNGIIILDTDYPLMSSVFKNKAKEIGFREGKSLRNSVSLAAAEMAGGRSSKVFAILYLLSEDLREKLSLVDEVYNLYKNVKLSLKDEITLVLCSYYQTAKMNEVSLENHLQCPVLLSEDDDILEEFLQISRGWGEEIKRQQEAVLKRRCKKEEEEENSLYAFLGRARLNIALDALQEVRRNARTCARAKIGTHARLYDAVTAHHRRSSLAQKLGVQVIKTYEPQLDEQNKTGQYVKVCSNNYNENKKALSKKSSEKCQIEEED